MPRDEVLLLDIANAARLIEEFTRDLGKSEFLADLKTQSSVLYQITVIGEVSRRLSESFRTANDQVPWPLIVGMRNRVIHEYDDVDLDEVWNTVRADIPRLLLALEPLLPDA